MHVARSCKRCVAAPLAAVPRQRQAACWTDACCLPPVTRPCRPNAVGAARRFCRRARAARRASPDNSSTAHGGRRRRRGRAAAALPACHVGERTRPARVRPAMRHQGPALDWSGVGCCPTLPVLQQCLPPPAPDTACRPPCRPPPSLAQFGGARTGYVFKLGPSGLGYYLDRPDTNRLLGEPAAAAARRAVFARCTLSTRAGPRLLRLTARRCAPSRCCCLAHPTRVVLVACWAGCS